MNCAAKHRSKSPRNAGDRRSISPSPAQTHDERTTKRRRGTGIPERSVIIPSGISGPLSDPKCTTWRPRAEHEKRSLLNLTMCEPELIFANLRCARGTVVARCGGCDSEMTSEEVLSWTCKGSYAVGKTVSTSVKVPLVVGRDRPTPDSTWTVAANLCTKCCEVPQMEIRTKI